MRRLNYKTPDYFAGSDKISDLRQVIFQGKCYDVIKVDKHYVIETENNKHYLCNLATQENIYATEYTLEKHK